MISSKHGRRSVQAFYLFGRLIFRRMANVLTNSPIVNASISDFLIFI